MTCPGQTDRLSIQVHRPVLLDFGAPNEVERMVLPSAISAESWCLSEHSSWVELCWLLTEGHQHPRIQRLGPLLMHYFVAT